VVGGGRWPGAKQSGGYQRGGPTNMVPGERTNRYCKLGAMAGAEALGGFGQHGKSDAKRLNKARRIRTGPNWRGVTVRPRNKWGTSGAGVEVRWAPTLRCIAVEGGGRGVFERGAAAGGKI